MVEMAFKDRVIDSPSTLLSSLSLVMSSMLSAFKKIWCVDFEFQSLPGEIPRPICVVALEVNTGERVELSGNELLATKTCPYSVGSDTLVVAYLAAAELGCHLSLGWPLPENILDLYAESGGLPTA
jgi:DNA polymerase-1